jgi:hypothetical protein
MSEELNLSNEQLDEQLLDVEGHLKSDKADKDDEVEGHLLDQNLLLDSDL